MMIGKLKSFTRFKIKDAARSGIRQVRRATSFFEDAPSFKCPCCNYAGKFLKYNQHPEIRLYAQCPKCGSLERHRLQYCVLEDIFKIGAIRTGSVIHFAPEPFIQKYLQSKFHTYIGADIDPRPTQVQADMRSLQFDDASFDLVYASHVLEHIKEDKKALSEIRRVLKPGGLAILPVPMIADSTVEYPAPSASEHFHVRAPGRDYYNKYREVFSRVEVKSSQDYDEKAQLYVYEDRTVYPNPRAPLRPPMIGHRHYEDVPICYV